MRIIKIVLGLLLIGQQLVAQTPIKILTEQKGISLRGLSVPSEKVVWASGSKGTVVKSINGGTSFEWMQVKGYEKRDFRAMHAWNDKEAIIVAVASPAIILKTKDGGASWYKVYENQDTAMFLDAIHFTNANNGTIIGDPVDGVLFMLTTNNKGEHWSKLPSTYFTSNLKNGEAFFASSNSNLVQVGKSLIMVTGGLSSRLWMNGAAYEMPIIQGTNSTGANSVAVSPNQQKLIVVGGDFTQDKKSEANIVGYRLLLEPSSDKKHLTQKKMILQSLKLASPNGYKSSIAFINNQLLITSGTSGVDISEDAGKSWQKISDSSYHVVKKHANLHGAFLAGSGGRIGYIRFK